MSITQKTPVHVITGFLGAGKTTFLNALIQNQVGKRIVVIENEVGQTNVDGALVVDNVEEVLELTAGCLCCNLNDKLVDILTGLAKRRAEFDVLLIETTGIADPSAVVETFWDDDSIRQAFEVRNTICLADAQNMGLSLEITDEARRQIAFADVILLNKCDTTTPDAVAELTATIRHIQPTADVFTGTEGVFPFETILETKAYAADHEEHRQRQLSATYDHKHKGIKTFTLTFAAPFDYHALSFRLMALMVVNKQQIFRIKGIIAVSDLDNQVIIQSVFKTFRVANGRAWQPGEARDSKIVFIGQDVDKATMQRLFEDCLVKA